MPQMSASCQSWQTFLLSVLADVAHYSKVHQDFKIGKMTSRVTAKGRLVRCPRCEKVLIESADFLYISVADVAQFSETNAVDLVVEDKESNSSNKEILTSLGECSLDQNNERDQKQSGDCISEQLGGINLSNEDQNDERNQSQSEDCYGEQLGGVNLSHNYQSGDIDKIESCDCNIEQLGVCNEVCLSTKLASQGNEEPSPIAQANSEVEANDEGLLSAGAKSQIDIKEGDSNFRSLNTDTLVATNGSISIATNHTLARESISSDTFKAAEFVNPSSELSGGQRDLSKSPTRSYYAYEGSVSSYDGVDDHLPERYIPSSGSAYKVSDFVPSEERHKKDKFQVNGMMNCSSYIEHEGEIHSSTKKHLANRSKWDQYELLEPIIDGHPVRNWRRRERDSHPSRVPFYQRGSLSGYKSGGPSHEVHNQFDHNTSFHSSGKSENLEQDRMKLLRMLSELQDELSKRCYPSGMANGRVSTKEKHIPSYYDHEAAKEVCHDLSYPRFPRRSMQGSNQLQQSNSSHIPFSGETAMSRHQAHHSCQHCCPQDWQCSVQLPLPILHHNKGSCWVHPGHNLYNSVSKETPPRFNHYSNSIVSLFPPATSPDSSENDEITITNPSIPSSFPQVFQPPNGQITLSIPLHFPPTMSDTSSESNQTLNGKTNLSSPLLFPAYKSGTETDDSTSSESNETFRTITSR
ncbi:hypothetical protein CFP56_002412 [Quercus suber]|uniref:Uncharacterized protein n=1 Tax=Quercus suber TaxID=58331 RepID=A0AAW0LFR8_QUESU